MLCEITIENVAVIEKATASFGGGFNVLTGETGAGKSILIDSINAILGNRTSRDIIRSGAAKACIWATFKGLSPKIANQLQEAGYPCEDELLLYREVSVDGKSNCRINGMPATAGMLRDICGGLINIHGQHDNQSLLNPARHLDVLDAFAQNAPLLEEYQQQYHQLAEVQNEIKRLASNEENKARKLELLRYEAEEIEGAALHENEEEELAEQRNVIRHSQTILDALNQAYVALSGGDEASGGAVLLGEAFNQMTAAARYAPDLASYADTLGEMYYSATEIATDIQNRLSAFEFDAQALDDVEQRLDSIFRLKQKYGPTLAAVLEYGEKARQQLEEIEFSSERLAGLEKQREALFSRANALAEKLTQSRKAAFDGLNSQIAEALHFLNMPGIVMALQYGKTALGPNGQDNAEFYISTNPGETPKPLAKIASGGELARIMLALKSALANRDEVETVIYDEIDTGISGLAAGRIGQLLQQTARGRQVICVTHTAQVAAYAKRHLLIEKQVAEGRTFTHIYELDRAARTNELARIISGDRVTDLARANAEEMLKMASGS
ncbi:MAG: DNA repair protein RecN [Oscillospiraceae bacterium]